MTKLIFTILFTLTLQAAGPRTICGALDDRISSFDLRIGRLAKGDKHMGCTVTMISKTCGITAGHCKDILEYAEFDVPLSNRDGSPNTSKLEDKYYIDRSSIQSEYVQSKLGSDWAVFKFNKNKITGKFPGEAYGYYKIGLRVPSIGEKITITGYGLDKGDPVKNVTQQTHFGSVINNFRDNSYFAYDVDTMGGNSGSSILNARNEIIGIHTNGGCDTTGGSNKGVIIRDNIQLRHAISRCLASN